MHVKECQRLLANHQSQEEVRKASPRGFKDSMTLSTPWFWISIFQNYETIKFYCFKPSSCWYFAMAALGVNLKLLLILFLLLLFLFALFLVFTLCWCCTFCKFPTFHRYSCFFTLPLSLRSFYWHNLKLTDSFLVVSSLLISSWKAFFNFITLVLCLIFPLNSSLDYPSLCLHCPSILKCHLPFPLSTY